MFDGRARLACVATCTAAITLVSGMAAPTPLAAQETPPTLTQRCAVPDSIVVRGNQRVTAGSLVTASDLKVGTALNVFSLQRAIKAIYALGQFDDVAIDCDLDSEPTRTLLVLRVRERAILGDVRVTGPSAVSDRNVRDRVSLLIGRPVDPSDVAQSRARIDSLYQSNGYYLAEVSIDTTILDDGRVGITFRVDEGRRLAVSGIELIGAKSIPAKTAARAMQTKPEGFWWFRRGEYDDDKFVGDLGERLPMMYARLGYVDMRVLEDTLIVDPERGKGLLRVTLDEGPRYEVGSFSIVGNRQFNTEFLRAYYPFDQNAVSVTQRVRSLITRRETAPEGIFDAERWEKATETVQGAYRDRGYLRIEMYPVIERVVADDSTATVNLRWEINENQPSIVNRIDVIGNDYTSEDCIRRAISLVPGGVFNQSALINSYQQIQNLGFFEAPMDFPSTKQINESGDVDIVFRLTEKRTGSVNFGASMGQGGVGFGGFIGVDQPNLFGACKRGSLNWQYGRFFNDFTLTYQDPSLRRTRTSGTISAYRSQSRFIVGNLGQNIRTGALVRLGFPVPWSFYSTVSASYGGESATFTSGFIEDSCSRNCFRSSIGLDYTHDTRQGLPFAVRGSFRSLNADFSGGPLGGSVNFQRYSAESRSYAEIATFGGKTPGSQPISVALGLTTRAGALFGNSGPFFFQQQFAVGGVMFGQQLRGYPEFSITPQGFNPNTDQFRSDRESFGNAFFTTTAELGLRLNQMIYANVFADAGNNWASPRQFNPTRLFRSAGFGVSTVTPLGPLGLDMAYGFDRIAIDPVSLRVRPDPRWQFHFRLGQLF